MSNVDELKEFALIHARAQQIPQSTYRAVLAHVVHDEEGPGSWVAEWSGAAEAAEHRGDLLAACRMYTMARFPHVDGEARRKAWERAVAAFDKWRQRDRVDLQRLDVELTGGRVRCWTTARQHADREPFVILMGGIVSTKEQYAPTLLRLRRFGVSGLVTEMPGVGANTLEYGKESWRMFSGLLDAVGGRARRAYAMAMSFSGHMALRCALEEPRLRAVLTVGAPVHGVFADPAWQRNLPRITVETLSHLAGTGPLDNAEDLGGLALTAEQLAALDIPVSYVASLRDEIIPVADIDLLRRHVRRLNLLVNDDVHGSPRHLGVTGPWLTGELLRAHGSRTLARAVLSALIPLTRARGQVGTR